MNDLNLHDSPFTGRSLIEASAGTGKTWTLTALYARLLLEREVADLLRQAPFVGAAGRLAITARGI